MDKVFLLIPHNKPSGGTKAINQTAQLFRVKGYPAYVVIPGKPYKADFIDDPAETIGLSDMVAICSPQDIIIDCWQLVESWKAVKKAKAKTKVFWQHGASIPIGRKFTGAKVFAENSIYNYQWNVSKACRDYIQKKYSVKKIDLVQPFSDSPTLKRYSAKRFTHKRNGILCLARRGSEYLPYLIKTFSKTTKITVIHGYHTEKDFFDELIRHKFFVSIDNGVSKHPFRSRIKRRVLSLFDPAMKYKNFWLVPKGHLLGFPMPPAEAARCGAVIIGFAMGGGLEWMSPDTCYLAKDRNLKSLLGNINKALNASEEELSRISEAAFQATNKFNKEHTWREICSSLNIQ